MLTTAVRALACLLTLTVLTSCNQNAPAPRGGDPYAGGKLYPWSSNLEASVDDPYAAGRNYPWSSPVAATGLDAQGVGSGDNQLSDLIWTSATNAWGPIEKDRSNGEQAAKDGRTLTIGGQTFSKGLGVHARSEIRYALGGQCSSFAAVVGIDDEVGNQGNVTFRVYGDGRLLADSGSLTGASLPKSLNVSITGVQELRLVVDPGSSPAYDHADWAGAKVNCRTTVPWGFVPLSQLAYVSATNGWGPVEFDRSNGEQAAGDGRRIAIDGLTYVSGLGTHAGSSIAYDLNGRCDVLKAKVGLDDEVGDRGSVVFQVFGDGTKLYDSGLVRGRDVVVPVAVLVTGVKSLKLVVTDGGDGNAFDHADWAEPTLDCAYISSQQPVLGITTSAGPYFVCLQGQVCRVRVNFSLDYALQQGDATLTVANLPVGVSGPQRLVVPRVAGQTGYPVDLTFTVSKDAPLNAPTTLTFTVAVDGLTSVATTQMFIFSTHGSFDPSFPIVGFKLNDESTASRLLLQPDGKMLAAGSSYQDRVARSDDINLIRYLPDGTLDSSFGSGGQVVLNAGGIENSPRLARASDGRIVVAGMYVGQTTQGIVVWRLWPDGRIDSTFGTQGRTMITADRTQYVTRLAGVSIQADGTVLVGGRRNNALLLARLTSGGLLDSSFGKGGLTLTPVSVADYDLTMATEADGRVMLAFTPYFGVAPGLGLARFRTDGTLDTTWNGSGMVLLQVEVTYPGTLARQPDGKWLVSSSEYDPRLNSPGFVIRRFDAAGRPDTSFGQSGRVQTSFLNWPETGLRGAPNGSPHAFAVQSDGKILVGGEGCPAYSVTTARYLPSGQLDSTWGIGGQSCLPLNAYSASAADLALDGSGRLWVATPVLTYDQVAADYINLFVVTRLLP